MKRLGNRGQSVVELAIALPVLLALVVGIFEFVRAWNVRQVLTNTAREGARLAVIPTSSQADVQAKIDAGLIAAALDPSVATITINGLGDGTGTPATIDIVYPYNFTFIGPVLALLDGASSVPAGQIQLSTSASMRNE